MDTNRRETANERELNANVLASWSAIFPQQRDEANAVGPLDGSRFYPDPFARTFLKTHIYQVGVC
ncbi:MAG: hypothetical protein JO025_04760 [Verrucomicrobia bacterium]|nr:hypothetical protein [Verrucomicrobiota bacterium]